MTKEEALQKLEFERKWLSDAGYNAYNVDIAFDSIRTIIKVLCGDEHYIPIPTLLDKIRAEIEQKCCITVGRECDPAVTLYDVFQIIDKYKAESEG